MSRIRYRLICRNTGEVLETIDEPDYPWQIELLAMKCEQQEAYLEVDVDGQGYSEAQAVQT